MKTVYIVQAYMSKDETGRLSDVTSVEIYAKNDKEAINTAKKYIKKDFYRVSNIIEKDE